MNEYLNNQDNIQEDCEPNTPPQVNPAEFTEESGFESVQAEVSDTETQPSEQVYNPVNYTPVTPVSDYKPVNNGLKIFALVLAGVILLTSTALVGYYAGKNRTSSNVPSIFQSETQPIDKNELTPAAVFEKVDPSIVGITVYNTNGNGGQASGIIYSKDGYIITNDHIYSQVPNAKFKIYTHDGDEYDAKFVAGDAISDLAVLKIDDCELTPATFGDSEDSYIGQRVVAIGRPNDATDTSSITNGIISATKRRVSNASSYSSLLIQTDTPINPGSSGGALVNMYGQIIGVTSSKLASVQHEGVGYAIPTKTLKRVISELITEGKVVSRAKLGITYVAVNSVTAEVNNLKYTGLRVESVTRDSDLYGKISKGDTIVKINDTDIKSDNTVLDIIDGCSAGDNITVTVLTAAGETKTLTAALRANPGSSSYTTEDSDDSSSEESNGTFNFPSGE